MESVNDVPEFSFDDGGAYIRGDVRIKTNSIESILTHLLENGIEPKSTIYSKNDEG